VTTLNTVPLTTDDGAVWTVSALEGPAPEGPSGRPIAATVPGEVHTDLLAAGEIPDPFDGDNESKLAWIGRTSWRYRTEFTWAADGNTRQELVAEGLDTVATVTLNGREFGRTANQHRSYRFDVTEVLIAGDNELVIEFAGPVSTAEEIRATVGDWPHTNLHPYNELRKMASTSAGTGVRTSRPWASGGRSGSSRGPACGSTPSVRWLVSTATGVS
jgi:beta-mannosidase